ncbi:liprin-beta-2-like isoform X2 [Sipha flava]|nr:liprin-beta-2-like isoform X2 [Sipha flava]XP_025405557.1 liprin-beta-2-like isoform X2 [Sipha flava]XP_025405558.1 liprin-beta-2-like isoform X2 [Sipha flava]
MKNDQDEELKLSKTHFDAIKLLEEALQKMDGIISLEPSSSSKYSSNSNVQTVLNNFIQQKNDDDPSCHLESFKLQVSVLNNQVDVLVRKLNYLEKYLLQQSELRQKAENKLQEELILKSKLETEKLEIIAILTNLKLVNLRLTKENIELKELLIKNKHIPNQQNTSCTPDVIDSQFHRTKNHGSRFYCSLPRHIVKKKNESISLNTEVLNDISESSVNLTNRRSQFDKCSSAPNLVDSKIDYQNEQIINNNSSIFSSTKIYSFQNSNLPIVERNRQQLYDWFSEQGIDYILQESKLWPNSGKELISSSISEIDEKFKFKHWLHRKKLILAIHCERNQNKFYDEDKYLSKARYLNTAWVLQWLDDIGLPQYKDTFSQAAINGITLHRLSKDDFLMLQSGNSDLHFSSLRYGIKVLRNNNFDPECLIRRSSINKNDDDCGLSLWTTHRVMEWLCSVNLAEYASNLRGSGVHGGLIVYDDRFTSDLLADILFIQQSKTLLRRHLSIQFNQLIGTDLNQKKRDAQSKSKYRPLTISSKVKIQKKSQFSLKRKKNHSELAIGDLICPIDD